MRVFGLGFVIELRSDDVAQTQNPQFILTPHYLRATLSFLGCDLCISLHKSNRRKCEGRLHGEWGRTYELLSQ